MRTAGTFSRETAKRPNWRRLGKGGKSADFIATCASESSLRDRGRESGESGKGVDRLVERSLECAGSRAVGGSLEGERGIGYVGG